MIRLTLPYPVSANRYWASRCIFVNGKWMPSTYVTKEAEDYRKEIGWLVKAAGIRAPLLGRIDCRVQLFPHRPLDHKTRMRKLGAIWDDTVQCIDLTNAEKVLLDALNGLVFPDDGRIWHYEADRMEPDEKGARIEMSVGLIAVLKPQAELLETTS